MKEILISRPVIFTLIGGLLLIGGILMWGQWDKTHHDETDTERRQHMERKTPEETGHTTQTKQGKTRGSTTHSYSHRYDNPRRKRQPIPQETSTRLDQLRLEYRDKIIDKRFYASSAWGDYEYDVYPDEYYEKELEILCGDMNPEDAADYLESIGFYSRALIERLDTVRAFQYLTALDDQPETRKYVERVIAENPGTAIELEARFYLADFVIKALNKESFAEKAQAYREILDIVPNSTEALSGLGITLFYGDMPAEAIPYLEKLNNLDPQHPADIWLASSYEKLGDVKTAWVYYKKALANGHPQSWLLRRHIKAIEAGDPIFKPVLSAHEPVSIDAHVHEHTPHSHVPQERTHHAEVLPDDPPWTEPESTSPQDTSNDNDKRRRAAAEAAQQAHDDFLKHPELSQKELDDFLQWAETIMNADSPMDTNNFLMKEMEAHLKGGQAQFEPDRIVRAFETMERYGPAEGIKHLQKADPDLAKQVQQLLAEKRTPHQNKKQN